MRDSRLLKKTLSHLIDSLVAYTSPHKLKSADLGWYLSIQLLMKAGCSKTDDCPLDLMFNRENFILEEKALNKIAASSKMILDG